MSNDKDKTRIVGAVDPDDPSFLEDLATYVQGKGSALIAAHLEVVEGPGAGQRLPVYEGPNPLGRGAEGNRVVLDFGDKSVSRVAHAIIVAEGAGSGEPTFTLYDGGKTNLVLLNGRAFGPRSALVPNDRFQVGSTVLRLLRD